MCIITDMHNLLIIGVMAVALRFFAPAIALALFIGPWLMLGYGIILLIRDLSGDNKPRIQNETLGYLIVSIPICLLMYNWLSHEPERVVYEPVQYVEEPAEPDPKTIYVTLFTDGEKTQITLEQCRDLYKQTYCDRLGCVGPRNTVTSGICNIF